MTGKMPMEQPLEVVRLMYGFLPEQGEPEGGEKAEIIRKLRQAEVLQSQGMAAANVICHIGVSGVAFYRWSKEYDGLAADELKRLKGLEKENQRVRRAVSDLTLDKLNLAEAAIRNC